MLRIPRRKRVQDKNLHVIGRAALLRRPRVQGRAAALPCQDGEDLCHSHGAKNIRAFLLLMLIFSIIQLNTGFRLGLN
jgi:hypothetical protein